MLTPRFLVSTASTLASNISQALVKANKWRRNLLNAGEGIIISTILINCSQ